MTRPHQKVTWIFAALAATVVLASPATAQTVSVNRCAAAKVRCVEGYTHVCGVQGVEGLFKCYQNATLRGRFVDQVCVNRTVDKLTECFRDAERLNAVCLTRNDLVAIQGKIATFVVDAVSDLIPGFPYPVTNTCAAGKQKTLSEATSQKLACFEEAFRREPGVVAPGCFNRAQAEYDYQWAKLEGNGGCLTSGDGSALASKMDSFVADMITSLDP
jgi:hypothetical protein